MKKANVVTVKELEQNQFLIYFKEELKNYIININENGYVVNEIILLPNGKYIVDYTVFDIRKKIFRNTENEMKTIKEAIQKIINENNK